MALIGLSVQDSQIVHIQGCTSGKDAWEKLSTLYENAGVANRLHLLNELMTSKMGDEQKVQEHIEHMRRVVGKLGTIGNAIDDGQYKLSLLRSLPNSYESLVVTLENLIDDLTIEDIHARIIREEARQSKNTDDGNTVIAEQRMLSAHGIVCHYCHKKGHKKAQCYAFKRSKTYNRGRRCSNEGSSSNQRRNPDHAFIINSLDGNTSTWYIDSGATYHAAIDKGLFVEGSLRSVATRRIQVADGSFVEATMVGTVAGDFHTKDGVYYITLMNVLYVPKMKVNLISVSCIQEHGYSITFGKNGCKIRRDRDGAIALSAPKVGRSYKIEFSNGESAYAAHDVKPNTRSIWHARLGHPGKGVVDNLSKRELIQVSDKSNTDVERRCTACAQGKMPRRSFSTNQKVKNLSKMDLVHSDLCGPMQTNSFGGSRYFLVLVDDATRMTHVAFLRKKTEVLKEFKAYVAMMRQQGHGRIRALRTDNGTEYCNTAFLNYLASMGIKHQTSAPYTPEQNGLAERTNRTLIEKARCMLSHAKLPRPYWAEAVRTAAYLKNLSPSRVIDNGIPEEKFDGEASMYGHLNVFGCLAYVHIPKEKRKKFDPVSRPCVFVGYTETTKQYRFIDPVSKRVVISATAAFHEDKTISFARKVLEVINIGDHEKETFDGSIIPSEDTNVDDANDPASAIQTMPTGDIPADETNTPEFHTPEQNSPTPTLRRSARHSTPPKRLTYEYAESDDDEDVAAMFTSGTNDEPENYTDAVTSTDAKEWKDSMRREYESLAPNDTWTLMPLPEGKKAIPCKWVYKIKEATRAAPMTYKSRLVAKGYKQKFGIDYEDTFAPVVRLTALRLLLSIAIQEKLHVHGMDVISAFLNGYLDHEIYMVQPEGYVDKEYPNHVCKLNKAVYGLKQSPLQWYNTIKPVLETVGVNACPGDSGIFTGKVNGVKVLLAIYVDDIFIACSSMDVMNTVKRNLSDKFAMTDMGIIKHYLGMDIEYNRDEGIVRLSQTEAINGILRRFRMEECKPALTPMETKLMLNPRTEHEDIADVPYRQIIGCLMYVMLCTRPDISYSIGVLSKFLEQPTKMHWTSAKRILRYLKGTKDYKLCYRRNDSTSMFACCDADWASSFDRKSTTGFAIFVNGNFVSWSSKKQSTVALSSTEAEIIAATETVREIIWIRQLLSSFGIKVSTPTLFCDSQPAIAIANSYGYNGRTKHMDVKYKFLGQCVSKDEILLTYKPTDEMVADLLTKALPRTHFEILLHEMGLTF